MTRTVLPGMLARKRGAIINIGSAAATVLPSEPLYAVYAATKAYVDQVGTLGGGVPPYSHRLAYEDIFGFLCGGQTPSKPLYAVYAATKAYVDQVKGKAS